MPHTKTSRIWYIAPMNNTLIWINRVFFILFFAVGVFTIATIAHEYFHKINFKEPINTCFVGYSESMGAVGWASGNKATPYNNEFYATLVDIIVGIIGLISAIIFITYDPENR